MGYFTETLTKDFQEGKKKSYSIKLFKMKLIVSNDASSNCLNSTMHSDNALIFMIIKHQSAGVTLFIFVEISILSIGTTLSRSYLNSIRCYCSIIGRVVEIIVCQDN